MGKYFLHLICLCSFVYIAPSLADPTNDTVLHEKTRSSNIGILGGASYMNSNALFSWGFKAEDLFSRYAPNLKSWRGGLIILGSSLKTGSQQDFVLGTDWTYGFSGEVNHGFFAGAQLLSVWNVNPGFSLAGVFVGPTAGYDLGLFEGLSCGVQSSLLIGTSFLAQAYGTVKYWF